LCFSLKVVQAADERPNVIFMLTDDLGYSDIGCYGSKHVKTPHIDKLAHEGVRYTHFRTCASICSPSRAAFLTGAYPQRCGLYMGINPNREAHWFLGLNPDEITIAEQLQSHGYATHMVGKWHLGTEPEFLPRKQGFDTYYGMPCNFGHSREFYDNDDVVFDVTPLNQLTLLYTRQVQKIIREHSETDEPFFLYYAHNYPHTPYQASARFKGKSKDGRRGDIMEEMDWGVGEMMKVLEETGQSENTIVIFSSDNGPTRNKYAKPFRGTKYVTFEGGHRVPFFIRWPAGIKTPAVSDAAVTAMDLFPTLVALTNSDLPRTRLYDGEDITPTLTGQPLKRSAEQPFYYYNCENLQAIQKGPWKLHLPRSQKQLPVWDQNKKFANLQHPVLYNMQQDQGETTNVAADHPEVVSEILKQADAIRKELGEFMKRGTEQRPAGSLFPDVPVMSHSRDWPLVGESVINKVNAEHLARHGKAVGSKSKQPRKRKPKSNGSDPG